ncbi:MAG: VacJ family lipoprotein [Betaproteobacteria bacterium]|nr:VacJ family lipoprotein [Betaproteobacteria bacterium]
MTAATARARHGSARRLLAVAALAALAGCATTGRDPADPFEGFNRSMYAFNESFDKAIGKPVATAYQDVVPSPARGWVRNFFSNVADLFIGVNNLLEGRPNSAVTSWARFAFNSSFGIFGFNDVASQMGLEKQHGDFGLTFGTWGAGTGPYLVWPLVGPSDVRDTVGTVFDWHFDPVSNHYPVAPRNAMILLRATSQRADLLGASRLLEEAALDKYAFQRDAYLQRRRSLIEGDHPSREKAPSSQAPAGAPHASSDASPQARFSSVYEPRTPANYQAVLAAERAK